MSTVLPRGFRLLSVLLLGCGLEPVSSSKDSGDTTSTGGTTVGAMMVSSRVLDFGELEMGDWSEMDLVISGAGESGFGLSLELTGEQFDVSETSLNVAAGVESVVVVSFEPDRPGSYNGDLQLNADTGDSLTVALRGVGAGEPTGTGDDSGPTDTDDDSGTTTDPPGPNPDIEATPSSMTFGSTAVGSSTTMTLLIANEGDAELNISQINTSGDFEVTGGSLSIPATLSPGANRTVDVTFSPGAAGTRSGTVRFTSDDPDESTLEVDLEGTGDNSCTICAPIINVSPTEITDFFVLVGFGGDSRTVTIYNEGDQDLEVTDVSVNNDVFLFPDGQFVINGISTPVTVRPGGRETFEVTFNATSSGLEIDQSAFDLNVVHVRSDDPANRDWVIPLAGIAL